MPVLFFKKLKKVEKFFSLQIADDDIEIYLKHFDRGYIDNAIVYLFFIHNNLDIS